MGYGNFLNWTGQHHHLLNLTGGHNCFLKSTCAYRNPPQPTPVKGPTSLHSCSNYFTNEGRLLQNERKLHGSGSQNRKHFGWQSKGYKSVLVHYFSKFMLYTRF